MKKILGILGVAMIAAAMFFSANGVSGSRSDTSLAGLIGMNVAHADAESSGETSCVDYCKTSLYCSCDYPGKDANGNSVTITCHDMYTNR